MKNPTKKTWSEFTHSEQHSFIQQATLLISKGYVQEKDIYKLAETIYNKSNDKTGKDS